VPFLLCFTQLLNVTHYKKLTACPVLRGSLTVQNRVPEPLTRAPLIPANKESPTGRFNTPHIQAATRLHIQRTARPHSSRHCKNYGTTPFSARNDPFFSPMALRKCMDNWTPLSQPLISSNQPSNSSAKENQGNVDWYHFAPSCDGSWNL
jgi:hypothetical protein